MLIGVKASNAAEYHFYHPDPLGSNVLVTNGRGEVVDRKTLTPYGSEAGGETPGSWRHQFVDQERDPESGFYDFGLRSYDPVIGRFLSVDPSLLKGGTSFQRIVSETGNLNNYVYALNRPTTLIDVNGEFAVSSSVALAGALLLSAGIILTSQSKPGSNVIPFPDFRQARPQSPTPTPTPGPTPGNPPDLPQATPEWDSDLDAIVSDYNRLNVREFRDENGNIFVDFGEIGGLRADVVLDTIGGTLEDIADREGGEASVRVRADDIVRSTLRILRSEDALNPANDRSFEFQESGEDFDTIGIKRIPPRGPIPSDNY